MIPPVTTTTITINDYCSLISQVLPPLPLPNHQHNPLISPFTIIITTNRTDISTKYHTLRVIRNKTKQKPRSLYTAVQPARSIGSKSHPAVLQRKIHTTDAVHSKLAGHYSKPTVSLNLTLHVLLSLKCQQGLALKLSFSTMSGHVAETVTVLA